MSQKAGLLDPAEQVSSHLHLSVVFELCHYLLIVFNSLMSIVFLELLCKKWAIPNFKTDHISVMTVFLMKLKRNK